MLKNRVAEYRMVPALINQDPVRKPNAPSKVRTLHTCVEETRIASRRIQPDLGLLCALLHIGYRVF